MININNFHEGTRAQFKLAKTYQVEKRAKGSKGYLMVGDIKKVVEKLINKDFKDFEMIYASDCSFYFYNKATNQLLRASNHWSRSNNPYSYIRTCYWTLDKESKDSNFKYKVGIVNLNEMKGYYE